MVMMMSENKNRAISWTEDEGIAQNARGPAVRETSSWPSRGGGGDRAFRGGRPTFQAADVASLTTNSD